MLTRLFQAYADAFSIATFQPATRRVAAEPDGAAERPVNRTPRPTATRIPAVERKQPAGGDADLPRAA
jgi:hypothetical protein